MVTPLSQAGSPHRPSTETKLGARAHKIEVLPDAHAPRRHTHSDSTVVADQPTISQCDPRSPPMVRIGRQAKVRRSHQARPGPAFLL